MTHASCVKKCLFLGFGLAASLLSGVGSVAAMTWVDRGQPVAVIVTPDEPAGVVRYAAGELVHHVREATGATLPVVKESELTGDEKHRIFLGSTSAAQARQLPLAGLADDAFLLRSVATDLFVAGSRDGEDPMREAAGADAGTLYGVYDLIERFLHVRWLWPGELGTYIPRASTVALPGDLDEVVESALAFRRFRSHMARMLAGNHARYGSPLTFSEEVARDYNHDLHVFKRRHRLGEMQTKPIVGHYFSGWWIKYGTEHPEWFAMDAQGQRGVPGDANESHRQHVGMCVSNPDLHRFIVEEAWDGGPILRLGEVDRRVFCQCSDCLAWDGPQPEEVPGFLRSIARPQVVSDRYARFWQAVYDRAVERNPEVVITTFLYWNYLFAPTGDFDFRGKVYGEFVPWGQDEISYWPASPEVEAWL